MAYAQYQQLQPIQTDFGKISLQAMDVHQRRQAMEQQKLAAVRKRDEELIKKIADYDSKFKVEDVQYHFQDEMMKVHSRAQKDLYNIHVQKTLMESSGDIGSDEYRSLVAKERSILSMPSQLSQTFKVFNDFFTDLRNNMGKPGGYDDYNNSEAFAKIQGLMVGNGWSYNYDTGMFDIKEEDGSVRSLTPGQFQRNPLIFSSPERYVDVDKEIKQYIDFIGSESQSYPTSNGQQVTVQKSKASDPDNYQTIFNWLDNAIEDESGFVRKVAGTRKMTKTQLIEYIMNGAGIKQNTRSATYDKSSGGGGGYQSKDDYYSQKQDEISNPMTVFPDGDAYTTETTGYDWVPIKRGTGVNVQPGQIVILSGETPDIKFQTGKESETVKPFQLSTITTGIDKFTMSGIQKMNVYNGDETYKISYRDKDRDVVLDISKGSVIPADLADKEGVMVQKVTKMPWYRPNQKEDSSLEAINNASDSVPMVLGTFYYGGSQIHAGIPVNETNNRAISTLNTETKKEKVFKDTGLINDYMSRFGGASSTTTVEPGTLTYAVDGIIYTIPSEEEEAFLSDFPNAKKQ